MKQIISEDGNIYYIKFRRDFISYLYLDVYIKTPKRFLFIKYKTKDRIGTTRMGSDKCRISDIHVDRLKRAIKGVIDVYHQRNSNSKKLEQWDGYLGQDNDLLKKKIMRDKKINNLLNGNTSELEDFLNKS